MSNLIKRNQYRPKYIWANMMICGFAPDFSHSEKQSPVPSPRTHPKYPWVLLAPAHGFSARDWKTRQNVGDGRTGIGQDTRRQVSRTGALPHYALCLCLVAEFQIWIGNLLKKPNINWSYNNFVDFFLLIEWFLLFVGFLLFELCVFFVKLIYFMYD